MTSIRILVVEDSRTVLERLLEVLAADPAFEVVGHASDGRTAMEMCERLRPDVLSLDMVLSGLSGLDVTRYVMASCATPILIVSSSANRGEAFDTLEALQAGAVEVFDKSRMSTDPAWIPELKAALRLVSRIHVVTRARSREHGEPSPPSGVAPRSNPGPRSAKSLDRAAEASGTNLLGQGGAQGLRSVVTLGASTGGPAAVAQILTELPADFRLPIVVVLHMTPLFASALAEWLGRHTRRSVRLVVDDEALPSPGLMAPILVAPPERHLVLDGGRLRLMQGPERHSCRPSIDVFFESLAAEFGPRTVAGLLTGMGRDGAAGLLALRNAHAITFAQEEASCAVYGMPYEALRIGATDLMLPLSQIAARLVGFSGADVERSTG
jgi:two-component system chemotaxis response regulator CheB